MSEKKIGRPSQMQNPKPITFKLEAELKAAFEDYASSCGQKVTDILRTYVTGLVAANKTKIANFRRQKNKGVKATFATPEPSKPAKSTKKKRPAQVDESVTSDDTGGDLKVGDDNENS